MHLGAVHTPQTSVAESRLSESLATQIDVLREEQRRTAEIDSRAEEAQKTLDSCGREKEASVKRQMHLSQTIAMFEDMLKIVRDSTHIRVNSNASDSKAKPVARVGKQHYRMLHALRKHSLLSLSELADASGVLFRSVKIKMGDDIEKGFVVLFENKYELTPHGIDLLKRFEDYRSSIGQPLPTLEPSSNEDENNDDDEDAVVLAEKAEQE